MGSEPALAPDSFIEVDYRLTAEELELHHMVSEMMVPGWVFWGPAAILGALVLLTGLPVAVFVLRSNWWISLLAVGVVLVIAAGPHPAWRGTAGTLIDIAARRSSSLL